MRAFAWMCARARARVRTQRRELDIVLAEKILGHREKNGVVSYFVKWTNFNHRWVVLFFRVSLIFTTTITIESLFIQTSFLHRIRLD